MREPDRRHHPGQCHVHRPECVLKLRRISDDHGRARFLCRAILPRERFTIRLSGRARLAEGITGAKLRRVSLGNFSGFFPPESSPFFGRKRKRSCEGRPYLAADFFHSFFWGADDGDMGMGAGDSRRSAFYVVFLNAQCPWRQIAAATVSARGCCLIRGLASYMRWMWRQIAAATDIGCTPVPSLYTSPFFSLSTASRRRGWRRPASAGSAFLRRFAYGRR